MPGPLSTWTWPPSWSVATNIATPPAVALARSARAVRAGTAVPAWLRPASMTLPMCSRLTAASVAGLGEVAGEPTMNSWPTRCARVIRASAARAASGAGAVGAVGRRVPVPLGVVVDVVEDAEDGGAVTGDLDATVVTARLGGPEAHPPAAAAPSRVAAVTEASSV